MLQRAIAENPTDPQLRLAYQTLRANSIQSILQKAEEAARSGAEGSAREAYARALSMDRENARAKTGIMELERRNNHDSIIDKIKSAQPPDDTKKQEEKLREVLSENGEHAKARALQKALQKKQENSNAQGISSSLDKAISIDLKDALIKQVFEVFSRTSAINFVLDKDIRADQKVTLFLTNTTVKEALEVVLYSNQLEKRALDTNTILIFPNTPAKLKDYQALTVRSFYLSNADPESVASALKDLLKMKDVIFDRRQNQVIVRDAPEAVRMAEKLVALYDLPDPEVMLEVEILEVNRNRLTALGIQYPEQITLTPLPSSDNGKLTLHDLKNIGYKTTGANQISLSINAKGQANDVNLLANPRIRAKNRETAKILIGEKVPNVTTTSTSTGFVSSNVQYLEVGLKLEITPTITIDNEVSIKISLEVSNIVNQVATKDEVIAYQIGTRSVSTVLRLKDGENQILAGLISDDDRRNAQKIPGIGDIPLLGKIFRSDAVDTKKMEVMLSITPRLLRNNMKPDFSDIEFESGTESSMRQIGTVRAEANKEQGQPTTEIPASAEGTGNPVTSAEHSATENTPSHPPALAWQAPSQVKAGDIFDVALNIFSDEPLAGFSLAIGLDMTKFDIVNVVEGSFLSEKGGTTSFSQRVELASEKIFISSSRNADAVKGATGHGSIARLTLRARDEVGAGSIRIEAFSAQKTDGSEARTEIPPRQDIDISAPSSVP